MHRDTERCKIELLLEPAPLGRCNPLGTAATEQGEVATRGVATVAPRVMPFLKCVEQLEARQRSPRGCAVQPLRATSSAGCAYSIARLSASSLAASSGSGIPSSRRSRDGSVKRTASRCQPWGSAPFLQFEFAVLHEHLEQRLDRIGGNLVATGIEAFPLHEGGGAGLAKPAAEDLLPRRRQDAGLSVGASSARRRRLP